MSDKQTHGFQAEVKQLLQLMIHSLYSNKEIFLRELISNSSDACDKLRFMAVKDDALYEGDSDLAIEIGFDAESGTVTITDNGIGMSEQEVIDNIGTIAKSGTKAFLGSLTGDDAKDSQLIGQFGVGFYSAFIVADRVTLTTRKAGEATATRWESSGEGEFTLEQVEKTGRGTEIVLHLREEEKEFAENWRLRGLISKYSDHVAFPIKMLEYLPEPEEGEEKKTPELEQVNAGSPLWTRSRSEVSDDEYKEFYKSVCHDYSDPLTWVHNKVEGKLEYTSLLYIPSVAPFDLWDRERFKGLKLYVQRVFIMDEAEQLLPRYLRFIRGVIDSSDLPLNVSRELLQGSKVIDSIKSGTVKKILSTLEKMAKNDAENFKKFWAVFGAVLKEGIAEDFANRERIAGICRFTTTKDADAGDVVSLAEYIERMPEGQEKIYYVTAETLESAKSSPHLEVFKKKGIEVLLLSDRVDEWVAAELREFDSKTLQSVAKGELDLGDIDSEEEKAKQKDVEEGAQSLIERLKAALEGRVKAVAVTHRLTDSPACVVTDENGMSAHLEQMLRDAGQEVPDNKPTLEVNVEHALVQKIDKQSDDATFADWAEVLLDQALLSERGRLENPAAFVKKLNALLLA